MSELVHRKGWLTTFGAVWNRFAPKNPDRLLEDYLLQQGEFSVYKDEAFERDIRRNMENRKLGIR